MKQYCKYCAFCIEIDSGYYCDDSDDFLTHSAISHANKCKDYAYTDVGAVDTGNPYKPHRKSKPNCDGQMSIDKMGNITEDYKT